MHSDLSSDTTTHTFSYRIFLQSGGRRIYDARVGQKRSANSIEFLLKDLYSAASHGVLSMSEERVSLYANDIDGTISSSGTND